MQFDVVIGLEVHAELKTKTKCFCACKNEYGNSPNSNCCPVCMGFPGALPVLNKKAVEQTVRAGLALNCEINRTAIFERKNYFYPDLAKAYQISQLEKPICINGHLRVFDKDIPINRIHLEEDAGKLIHQGSISMIDYNRGGVPLIELVTDALKEPHIESAEEAVEFLTKLRQIYVYSNVADCEVEKGQMRADVNVSLKEKGSKEFGTKVEMKNIMGFKAVYRAIKYEIERQKEILEDGGVVVQETRRWDDDKGESYTLRTKENSEDYRYFPDPDLLAVNISDKEIALIKESMLPLPDELKERYVKELNLTEYDADVILAEKEIADFFNECLTLFNKPKLLANWISTEILSKTKNREHIKVSAKNFVWIVKAVDDGKLQRNAAKDLLSSIWGTNLDAEAEAKAKGIMSDLSSDYVKGVVEKILSEKQDVVSQYRQTKDGKILNFLVGQVMKETRGKANAQEVMRELKEKLD